MRVHRQALEAAIDSGARTVEDLRRLTRASAGCGTCRPDLERLLAERLSAAPSGTDGCP
jgi:NAD(P)H-nitrite reductase large subunit